MGLLDFGDHDFKVRLVSLVSPAMFNYTNAKHKTDKKLDYTTSPNRCSSCALPQIHSVLPCCSAYQLKQPQEH